MRKRVFAVAAAGVIACVATGVSAETATQRPACTPDVLRLCSSEIPNIPAVTACMIKNRSSLSSGCRAVLDKEVAKRSGKIAEINDAMAYETENRHRIHEALKRK